MREPRRSDSAVSTVVGSMLLIAITVAAMAAFALFVRSIDGPQETLHADFAAALEPGSGGWGTGDERLVLRHVGGEALRRADASVTWTLAGERHTRSGQALDGGFSDGALQIGETWSVAATIAQEAVAEVLVAGRTAGSSSLLHAQHLRAVPFFAPAPPAAPEALTYSDAFVSRAGLVLAGDQAQAEDGSEATLTEATFLQALQAHLPASQVTAAAAWQDTAFALRVDGLAATATAPGVTLELGLETAPGRSGRIDSVQVVALVSIEGGVDDGFDLTACMGGLCTPSSGPLAAGDAYAALVYDITALRPSLGAWDWADFASMRVEVTSSASARADGTWRVDGAWIDVGYQPPSTTLDVEATIAGIPAGTSHALEVGYRTLDDAFHVEVWNGWHWQRHAPVLDSGSPAHWSSPLAPFEVRDPLRVRFLDSDPAGPSAGVLHLDHVRVRTQ